MTVTLLPGPAQGTLAAIPSKSAAHRLLICAALGDRPVRVVCHQTSQDIEATVRCLNGLGASIRPWDQGYDVTPLDRALVWGQVVEGLSYRELAAIHGRPETALRSRCCRAKQRLAAWLGDGTKEEGGSR